MGERQGKVLPYPLLFLPYPQLFAKKKKKNAFFPVLTPSKKTLFWPTGLKNSLLSGATTYFLARTLKKISRLTVKKKCPTGNPSLNRISTALDIPTKVVSFL